MAFVNKNWPQRELNAVLNQEAASGEVKVLPLLVGTEEEKRQILSQFPLLNDKRYLPWDGNLRGIVNALLQRLHIGESQVFGQNPAATQAFGLRIPLPKIKKQFSQRDKDLFSKDSFSVIKNYFRDGLTALNKQYTEVEIDFSEVHNLKFLATIYVRGEIANKCKIWIGGLSQSNSIAYQSGQFNIDSDNSFTDMLSVSDDKQALGFQPSGMWMGAQQYGRNDLLTVEQAAEYLWNRFTDSLT